jgi:outer membrane protein OmpA-like peptidoglycan-associated protein/tetratricopeptide (TPR) repeat protein
MNRIIFTILFLLVGKFAVAQHSSMAYRKLADSLYAHHHYQFAADFYEKALKKSPHQGNIMIQLAKCYHKINLLNASEEWFIKAKQNRGAFSTEDYYLFAQVLMMLKKKDHADTLLAHVLERDPDNKAVKKELDDLRNSQRYYQDSAAIAIQSLSVNTAAPEFSPVYYKDGIVFSSSRHEGAFKKKSHWDNNPFLNLYFSQKKGEQGFAEATLFEDDLSTKHHDGPATFYAQYQKMIINRNQRVKVQGREKLYEWRPGLYDVQFDPAKSSWKIEPLPFSDPANSYLHPSISEDGKVLYFASDRPGGYGGTDLYRVERSNGVWGKPINLGPFVNTEEDEAFPFFIENTLYFASNGHGGLGGLDIFKSENGTEGFTQPVNLGYPINTTADDFSLVTEGGQRNGYFASSRHGNDDLFSFEKLATHEVLAMGLVTNMAGEVVDGFKATVTNKKTGSSIPVQTDKGVLTFTGERGQSYGVTVEHEKYQTANQDLQLPTTGPDTEKFSIVLRDKTEDLNPKLLVVDTDKGTSKMYLKTGKALTEITEKDNQLYLKTPQGTEYFTKGNLAKLRNDATPVLKELGMEKSDRTNLRNIYFDFDKANLDEGDEKYLNDVKNILEHDPSLKLLVAGHADDRGEEDYNIWLSKKRVQAVTKYLTSKGINKNRIIEKAYGESLPVIPCYEVDCSEDDHQKNRRAEFVLRNNISGATASPLSKKSVNENTSSQR